MKSIQHAAAIMLIDLSIFDKAPIRTLLPRVTGDIGSPLPSRVMEDGGFGEINCLPIVSRTQSGSGLMVQGVYVVLMRPVKTRIPMFLKPIAASRVRGNWGLFVRH